MQTPEQELTPIQTTLLVTGASESKSPSSPHGCAAILWHHLMAPSHGTIPWQRAQRRSPCIPQARSCSTGWAQKNAACSLPRNISLLKKLPSTSSTPYYNLFYNVWKEEQVCQLSCASPVPRPAELCARASPGQVQEAKQQLHQYPPENTRQFCEGQFNF